MRSVVSSRTQSSPRARPGGRARRGRPAARVGLARRVAVVLEAETADEPRQRQALQHERREDHGVGQEDDQVALGERRARVVVMRDREAAASDTAPRMPGPPDEDRACQRTGRLALAHAAGEQPRQVGEREDPQRSAMATTVGDDDDGVYHEAPRRRPRCRRAPSAASGRPARTAPSSARRRAPARPRRPGCAWRADEPGECQPR